MQLPALRVMFATCLLVCFFLRLEESTGETRKNVFYIISEVLFVLEKTNVYKF